MNEDDVRVTPNTEITVNISREGHAVIAVEERDSHLVSAKVVIPAEWIGRAISRAEILEYVHEGLSQGLVERLLFPHGMGKARLDKGPDLLAEVDRELEHMEADFGKRGSQK